MIQPSNATIQHDFDQYVNRATILIHSPQSRKQVLAMLLAGSDPVQRVSDATVMIMHRLDSTARDAGIEVQDAVKVMGAHAIVGLIVEFGNAAKIFNLNDDLSELSLSVAVQDYVRSEVKAGRVDPQKLKVAFDADLRSMPPKFRKEAQLAQQRIPMIARQYNHGKGLASFTTQKQVPEN